ncbi:uncharacterized protein [Spinacia oleracea]|uniref:Uncharacterized protein isoform X3 n=1 Tax=Spinacia oleracea TaxID=3562 RepID=A0ABM3RMH6_SPIOL|nr:uncharacterized protein LOC110775549 isoform X3 [Spinacia oleracea]
MATAEACTDGGTVISRLFSLIEKFLPRPFTELELITLTKEKETELLISLSQTVNKIRCWTDGQLQQGSIRSSDSRNSDLHCGDDELLTKIIANLVSLLNAKSQYVRHMVGNIFLVISEFLLPYGGSWDEFIHLLCVCFELAMCNILRHLPQSLVTEADNSKSIVSNMKLVLDNSTWNGIAEILRILRGIVKQLKGTDDDESVGVLLDSLSICLTKIPWDLLNGIHDSDVKVGGSSGEAAAKLLFMGNLVQLLCSVVSVIGYEDSAGSDHKLTILHETCDIIPRLLVWCHVEEWSHILQYFRHKILMLMTKLSIHMQLDCSVLILWLQLLHEYYQDLLSSSISELECGQNDTLDGSPFLLSLDDQEVCQLSSHHLQRKSVFLFLRWTMSLINLGKTSDFKCTCARPNSFIESDLKTVKDCFAKKKGLLQLHGWLQGHVPSNVLSENGINLDKCIKFAASFIRFYMQEDDMLFEVLLQMFTIPSWADRLFSEQGRACHDTEDDILFYMSNLFNPLLLFHVFLAELQYDHQLLLDYLISKDVGGKCAEYLLRCLRIVCDSWKLFVEYSVRESLVCQGFSQEGCKRRRASHEDSSDGRIDTTGQSKLGLLSEQNQGEFNLGSKFFGSRYLQVEGAKGCLLSLKSALRKLHKRKLFPYNPEVLIRRPFVHLQMW